MCSALSGSGIDLNVLVACKSRVLGCALKILFLIPSETFPSRGSPTHSRDGASGFVCYCLRC